MINLHSPLTKQAAPVPKKLDITLTNPDKGVHKKFLFNANSAFNSPRKYESILRFIQENETSPNYHLSLYFRVVAANPLTGANVIASRTIDPDTKDTFDSDMESDFAIKIPTGNFIGTGVYYKGKQRLTNHRDVAGSTRFLHLLVGIHENSIKVFYNGREAGNGGNLNSPIQYTAKDSLGIAGNYLDVYTGPYWDIAQIALINTDAPLDPLDYGEHNADGVWVPKILDDSTWTGNSFQYDARLPEPTNQILDVFHGAKQVSCMYRPRSYMNKDIALVIPTNMDISYNKRKDYMFQNWALPDIESSMPEVNPYGNNNYKTEIGFINKNSFKITKDSFEDVRQTGKRALVWYKDPANGIDTQTFDVSAEGNQRRPDNTQVNDFGMELTHDLGVVPEAVLFIQHPKYGNDGPIVLWHNKLGPAEVSALTSNFHNPCLPRSIFGPNATVTATEFKLNPVTDHAGLYSDEKSIASRTWHKVVKGDTAYFSHSALNIAAGNSSNYISVINTATGTHDFITAGEVVSDGVMVMGTNNVPYNISVVNAVLKIFDVETRTSSTITQDLGLTSGVKMMVWENTRYFAMLAEDNTDDNLSLLKICSFDGTTVTIHDELVVNGNNNIQQKAHHDLFSVGNDLYIAVYEHYDVRSYNYRNHPYGATKSKKIYRFDGNTLTHVPEFDVAGAYHGTFEDNGKTFLWTIAESDYFCYDVRPIATKTALLVYEINPATLETTLSSVGEIEPGHRVDFVNEDGMKFLYITCFAGESADPGHAQRCHWDGATLGDVQLAPFARANRLFFYNRAGTDYCHVLSGYVNYKKQKKSAATLFKYNTTTYSWESNFSRALDTGLLRHPLLTPGATYTAIFLSGEAAKMVSDESMLLHNIPNLRNNHTEAGVIKAQVGEFETFFNPDTGGANDSVMGINYLRDPNTNRLVSLGQTPSTKLRLSNVVEHKGEMYMFGTAGASFSSTGYGLLKYCKVALRWKLIAWEPTHYFETTEPSLISHGDNLYAISKCKGPSGSNKWLTVLKYDTLDQNTVVSPIPSAANSWKDNVEAVGVAFLDGGEIGILAVQSASRSEVSLIKYMTSTDLFYLAQKVSVGTNISAYFNIGSFTNSVGGTDALFYYNNGMVVVVRINADGTIATQMSAFNGRYARGISIDYSEPTRPLIIGARATAMSKRFSATIVDTTDSTKNVAVDLGPVNNLAKIKDGYYLGSSGTTLSEPEGRFTTIFKLEWLGDMPTLIPLHSFPLVMPNLGYELSGDLLTLGAMTAESNCYATSTVVYNIATETVVKDDPQREGPFAITMSVPWGKASGAHMTFETGKREAVMVGMGDGNNAGMLWDAYTCNKGTGHGLYNPCGSNIRGNIHTLGLFAKTYASEAFKSKGKGNKHVLSSDWHTDEEDLLYPTMCIQTAGDYHRNADGIYYGNTKGGAVVSLPLVPGGYFEYGVHDGTRADNSSSEKHKRIWGFSMVDFRDNTIGYALLEVSGTIQLWDFFGMKKIMDVGPGKFNPSNIMYNDDTAPIGIHYVSPTQIDLTFNTNNSTRGSLTVNLPKPITLPKVSLLECSNVTTFEFRPKAEQWRYAPAGAVEITLDKVNEVMEFYDNSDLASHINQYLPNENGVVSYTQKVETIFNQDGGKGFGIQGHSLPWLNFANIGNYRVKDIVGASPATWTSFSKVGQELRTWSSAASYFNGLTYRSASDSWVVTRVIDGKWKEPGQQMKIRHGFGEEPSGVIITNLTNPSELPTFFVMDNPEGGKLYIRTGSSPLKTIDPWIEWDNETITIYNQHRQDLFKDGNRYLVKIIRNYPGLAYCGHFKAPRQAVVVPTPFENGLVVLHSNNKDTYFYGIDFVDYGGRCLGQGSVRSPFFGGVLDNGNFNSEHYVFALGGTDPSLYFLPTEKMKI